MPLSDKSKPADYKIILLGDSAVGKSKLIERFLLDDFVPQQLSTYALTMYRHECNHPSKKNEKITVEFWDTAGQERFQSMHPSYYMGAHAAILCFDMTRKITYKHLDGWYDELTEFRGTGMPVIVVANKVDMEPDRARRSFGFVQRRREERGGGSEMPLFLCSASDGTNVVSAFREAIGRAVAFKEGRGEISFVDEVLNFIREEETDVYGTNDSLDAPTTTSESVKTSSESLGESGLTLYKEDRKGRFNFDSDEEELEKSASLAKLESIRKANKVLAQ